MQATEVKVKASAVASVVAGAVVAILNQVVGNAALMGGLPPWLQFVILLAAPGVIAWLGGYSMPSTTSSVSKGFTP